MVFFSGARAISFVHQAMHYEQYCRRPATRMCNLAVALLPICISSLSEYAFAVFLKYL